MTKVIPLYLHVYQQNDGGEDVNIVGSKAALAALATLIHAKLAGMEGVGTYNDKDGDTYSLIVLSDDDQAVEDWEFPYADDSD